MKKVFVLLCIIPVSLFITHSAIAKNSSIVYPEQAITLRFFHSTHIELEIECDMCHSGALTSTTSSGRVGPENPFENEEHTGVCADCHDGESAPNECETCHPDPDNPEPMTIPDPNLIFPHKTHIDKEMQCSVCHGDLREVDIATVENLPSMETCLDCHNGFTTIKGVVPPSECSTCHLSDDVTGTLRLDYPQGKLKPESHVHEWFFKHRPWADAERALCANCHEEDFCLSCHNGKKVPLLFHKNDWIHLHPNAAKTNRLNCDSCHSFGSFCRECHKKLKVTSDSFSPSKAFHPEGWMQTASSEFHKYDARTNIKACVGCHDEDSCIKCHGTKGLNKAGKNPHGSMSRAKIMRIKDNNIRACLKCHKANDPLIR